MQISGDHRVSGGGTDQFQPMYIRYPGFTVSLSSLKAIKNLKALEK